MNKEKRISNIIEALSKHEDSEAIRALETVGTNCSDDEIRRLTARALVNRNSDDALSVVILQEGKGINDLSTSVAMSTINELLALDSKDRAIKVLSRAEEEEDLAQTVKDTARSVKALMAFSS